MLARPLLLAAILAPAAVMALPWDGTYRLSEEADCGKVGEEGGALRIGEGVLQGVGSTCRMSQPVDVLDLDATLYEMACEGEGQSWTERALLMKAAEGDAIFLAWRGYVFRYDRCPAPDEAAESDADGGVPASDPEPVETEVEGASEDRAGEDVAPLRDDASDGAPAREGPAEADSAPPGD